MEPIPTSSELDELFKDNLNLKKQINQLKIENTQLKIDKNEMKKNLEKARLIINEQRKKIISPPPILDSNGNFQPTYNNCGGGGESNSNVSFENFPSYTPSKSLSVSAPSISTTYKQQIPHQSPSKVNFINENIVNNNKNLESIINMDIINNSNNKSEENRESCDLEMGDSPTKRSPMIKSFSLPSINLPFFSFHSNNRQLVQLSEQQQLEIEYPIESMIDSGCSTPNGSVSSKSNITNSNNGNNGILLETIKNMLKKNKERTKEQEISIRQLKLHNNNLQDQNSSYKERIENLEKKLLNITKSNNTTINNSSSSSISSIDNNYNNNSLTRSPSKLLNSIRLSPSISSNNNVSSNNTPKKVNNNKQPNEVYLEVIEL